MSYLLCWSLWARNSDLLYRIYKYNTSFPPSVTRCRLFLSSSSSLEGIRKRPETGQLVGYALLLLMLFKGSKWRWRELYTQKSWNGSPVWKNHHLLWTFSIYTFLHVLSEYLKTSCAGCHVLWRLCRSEKVIMSQEICCLYCNIVPSQTPIKRARLWLDSQNQYLCQTCLDLCPKSAICSRTLHDMCGRLPLRSCILSTIRVSGEQRKLGTVTVFRWESLLCTKNCGSLKDVLCWATDILSTL